MALWNGFSSPLTAGRLQSVLNATATAAMRLAIRAGLVDGGYLYKIHPAETAAGLTDADLTFGHEVGNCLRYGADPTGTADSTTAWQNALKVSPVAFDGHRGNSTYKITATLNFLVCGQIIQGNGMGDNNTVGSSSAYYAPRTTLKWEGAAGGTVVSLYNANATPSAGNLSETCIRDLCIDGNSLANWGVAYDDTVQTGSWRNVYERVAIINCTGGTAPNNPACIYMGADTAGGFANDSILRDCYFQNSANGIYGNCAMPQLHSCTIANMTTAAIHLPGYGSEMTILGGVIHSNAIDLLLGGAAGSAAVQNVTCVGTWFENSTTGILKCSGSFDVKIFGGHLHSFAPATMFDLGGQAGSLVVKAWNGQAAAIYVVNDNGAYDMDFVGTSGLNASTGEKLRIAQDGGIGQIGNAKFDVELTNTAANVTGDGTAYALFSGGVSKNFDLNNAVAAGTGVFTAPTTGKYLFDVQAELSGVLAAHNDAQLYVTIAGTSAGTSQMARTNPGANLLAGTSEANIHGQVMVTMTKGDTATVYLMVGGSTKVVGPLFGPGSHERTRFQGRLV